MDCLVAYGGEEVLKEVKVLVPTYMGEYGRIKGEWRPPYVALPK